tara:strand:- start:1087 stop:1347 length:261 start_codon:yes stop_codon:yes gene_type:complete
MCTIYFFVARQNSVLSGGYRIHMATFDRVDVGMREMQFQPTAATGGMQWAACKISPTLYPPGLASILGMIYLRACGQSGPSSFQIH